MSVIGTVKTLIIACGACELNRYVEFSGRIFIYSLPHTALQEYDTLEKGRIQYYIESKECKQVVFVGPIEQNLVDQLLQNDLLQSIHAKLKFNLSVFLGDQDKAVLSKSTRDQMLIELHVISQCSLLMEYYFIRERVENGQLRVQGIVTEMQDEQFKPIFNNGITYNDIISMN